jgi:hypothetical protein
MARSILLSTNHTGASGDYDHLILTQIPEPSAAGLLAGGMLGLAALRRRRPTV